MRRLLLAAVLLAAPAGAEVTFVSPQRGAQAVGRQVLEITTDAPRVDRVEFTVDGVLAGVARTAPYRVLFDFGTDRVGARTIRARVFSGGYRMTEVAEITTEALTAGESINVDLVEVPMRVRSRKAVKAADVRVRENGVEQSVREVLQLRPPAHFAFVVDRSLSMAGGKLEAALRAIDEARAQLRDGDTASLILFNHHVARPITLGKRSDATTALATTVPSGGTSLRDALVSSIARRPARTYVIVITDGGDRNSVLTEDEALRRMAGARTVVSAITMGSRSPFLERAARATGGTLAAATRETAARQLASMLQDINSRYTLVYQSSGTRAGWRTIEVTGRARGLEIASARTRYFSE